MHKVLKSQYRDPSRGNHRIHNCHIGRRMSLQSVRIMILADEGRILLMFGLSHEPAELYYMAYYGWPDLSPSRFTVHHVLDYTPPTTVVLSTHH
jgi:hypothetical protein